MAIVIDLLFSLLDKLMTLLPLSPFLFMIGSLDEIEVLGVVNWFIPFDTCALFMEIWIAAIVIYYVYLNFEKIVSFFLKIKSLIK